MVLGCPRGREVLLVISIIWTSAWLLLPERAAASEHCAQPAARLVSVFGQVEHRAAGSDAWRPAELDATVCPEDRIRTGTRSRAAIVFLDTDTVLRIDQNTTLRVRTPKSAGRTLLDLLRGAVQFFSRTPRALEVDTPFVNAAVEGTEFYMVVGPDQAILTVFEGRVAARNARGELTVTDGQSLVATRGAAPQARTVVRPRDAVQWALYYPPVLSGAGVAGVTTPVKEAADLLAAGRVSEAATRLDAAGETAPALALRAVIAVARNDRAAALMQGRAAVAANPDSSAARIALSYALQASFDIEAARDVLREAVKRQPGDALAWARLAELYLSLGALDDAIDAAARAAEISPDVSRMNTVLGFAALAQIRTNEAREAFTRAIGQDSQDPLPRLGLGLAKIRDGDLTQGRREIEIATALDPGNSLIRSYLGKSYYEERRERIHAKQFEIAKQLDPLDPTPYLYDAVRRQSENDPIGALSDIETSIELNDNRAVYRSRLLLDEDLAARGARLGSIYRDLGFEQLALTEGWKSLAVDPTSFSAHRLLADTYATLPRHEIARDSELLQSQLLQPLNVNPVQPRLASNGLGFLDDTGPSNVGFNEFSRLFARNGVRFQGDGLIGGNDLRADNMIVSALADNVSLSLGQFYLSDDGFRQNNDLNQRIYNGFIQTKLSENFSVLGEIRNNNKDSGERRLFFFEDRLRPQFRQTEKRTLARGGLRYDVTRASTILMWYMNSKISQNQNLAGGSKIDAREEGNFTEGRYIFNGNRLSFDFGLGYFNGRSEQNFLLNVSPPPFPPFFISTITNDKIIHKNGYAYVTISYPDNLATIVGVSGDTFNDPFFDKKKVSPKLGVIWDVTPDLVFRIAMFETLRRTLVSSQTIEPTEVAGFNQFFDDPVGSEAFQLGVAVDQKLDLNAGDHGPDLYLGAELFKRRLDVPTILSPPAVPTQTTVDQGQREIFGRAYVNWVATPRLALIGGYRYTRLVRDASGETDALAESTTQEIPFEARYFDPNGIFARARATYVYQKGQFQDQTRAIASGRDRFWVFDGLVGYRFGDRRGIASIEVRNLLNETFRFQDIDPEDSRIARERLILFRLTLSL